MHNVNRIILLAIAMLSTYVASAQQSRTDIKIDFRVSSAVIDSNYMNNAEQLSQLKALLQNIKSDSTIQISHVAFRGTSSPEGNYQINKKLANQRMKSLEDFICSYVTIPNGITSYDDTYIPWEYLAEQIKNSTLQHKQEILDVIAEEPKLVPYHNNTLIDHRIIALKQIHNGSVWQQLNAKFFSAMRNAYVLIITFKEAPKPVVVPEPEPEPTPEPEPEPTPEPVVVPEPVIKLDTTPWERSLHIKTNALGWGLLISNIGLELDLAKHFSFAVPLYYSAWDFIKATIKFRTFAIQPEMKYWFKPENSGLYLGAHFGMAYYNLATDGKFRYQDLNRHTPALGGGLSVGYRMPLGKKQQWHVEFAIGAGIYSLRYNTFENTPNTKQGLLVGSTNDTYFGIDQLSVNFSRSFNFKKKGGNK